MGRYKVTGYMPVVIGPEGNPVSYAITLYIPAEYAGQAADLFYNNGLVKGDDDSYMNPQLAVRILVEEAPDE